MNINITLCTVLLAGAAWLSSCNKEDKASGDLSAGQCSVSFNTDKDFNGTSTINIPASMYTTAVKSTMANKDMFTLNATKVDIGMGGGKTANALMTLHVPLGATTSGGSLSGEFAGKGDITGTLTVSHLSAGQSKPAYSAEGGSIIITKLTATELEGNFTAQCVNEDDHTTLSLSNGKFVAKFK